MIRAEVFDRGIRVHNVRKVLIRTCLRGVSPKAIAFNSVFLRVEGAEAAAIERSIVPISFLASVLHFCMVQLASPPSFVAGALEKFRQCFRMVLANGSSKEESSGTLFGKQSIRIESKKAVA